MHTRSPAPSSLQRPHQPRRLRLPVDDHQAAQRVVLPPGVHPRRDDAAAHAPVSRSGPRRTRVLPCRLSLAVTADPLILASIAAVSLVLSHIGATVGLVLGQLRLPLLIYALGSVTVGTATSLAISTAGTLIGTIRHTVDGRVRLGLLLTVGAPSGAAAYLTARYAGHVDQWLLKLVIAVVLIATGARMLIAPRPPAPRPRPRPKAPGPRRRGRRRRGPRRGLRPGRPPARLPAPARDDPLRADRHADRDRHQHGDRHAHRPVRRRRHLPRGQPRPPRLHRRRPDHRRRRPPRRPAPASSPPRPFAASSPGCSLATGLFMLAEDLFKRFIRP
jgi:hypothetical protein